MGWTWGVNCIVILAIDVVPCFVLHFMDTCLMVPAPEGCAIFPVVCMMYVDVIVNNFVGISNIALEESLHVVFSTINDFNNCITNTYI